MSSENPFLSLLSAPSPPPVVSSGLAQPNELNDLLQRVFLFTLDPNYDRAQVPCIFLGKDDATDAEECRLTLENLDDVSRHVTNDVFPSNLQISFVLDPARTNSDGGSGGASRLYSSRLAGTRQRRSHFVKIHCLLRDASIRLLVSMFPSPATIELEGRFIRDCQKSRLDRSTRPYSPPDR